jgi:hypothetical protein
MWEWVYLARPTQIGLLYQPRTIDDECEAVGGLRIGKDNRNTREILLQRHFVHHKSHMIWPGLEPGPLSWEASK